MELDELFGLFGFILFAMLIAAAGGGF